MLDTAPDFVVTLKQLANEYDTAPVADNKIRQTVSDGARALTTLLFGLTEGETGFEERRQRLLDIYFQHMGNYCRLFEGMESLLKNIHRHNLHWGIVTNKPVRFTEPLIKDLTLPSPPSVLICPDHVSKSKPSPEPLLLACK